MCPARPVPIGAFGTGYNVAKVLILYENKECLYRKMILIMQKCRNMVKILF